MKLIRQFCNRGMIAVCCTVLIASCGGGGGGGGGSSSSGNAGGGGNGGVVALGASSIQESGVSVDVWMQDGVAELHEYADADGDGLHDSVDPDPNAKPTVAELFGSDALEIAEVWSEIDGQRAPDAFVQGAELTIRMQGLPAGGAESVWLVYQTDRGLRATEADRIAADLLRARINERAGYVHIVVGLRRTERHAVVYLDAGDPVLFADANAHAPGETVTLFGRNLQGVNAVQLGGQAVELLSTSPEQLRVRLPAAPSDFVITAFQGDAFANTVALDIRQDVTVSVDPQLLLPSGQYLVYWYGAERRLLRSGETFTVSLPASSPTVLTFDVESAAGVRFYTMLHAVVWPGETAAAVSARSTLLARLLRNRESLPDGSGRNWTTVRTALERGLQTPAALDLYAGLYALLASGTPFQIENAVHDAMAAYRQVPEQDAAAGNLYNLVASDIRTGPGKFLDDYIGSTIALATEEGANADADAGADYAFRRLETIGNDYSQILVQSHEGVRNIFTIPTECSFGGGEQQWRNTNFVWRSDLCMQLDGQVYVSYALIKPGLTGDIEAILDAIGAGNEPLELLHSHAEPESLEDDKIFGPGGYYLKDDAGNPECGMETCYVEFLTGGYSGGSQIALTSRQEKVVDTLRARMWAEIMASVLIKKLAGIDFSKLPVSDQEASKFRKCVEGNFVKTIAKAGVMADAAILLGGTAAIHKAATQDEYTGQVFAQFTNKLGDWLEKYAKGQLSEPFFLSCLTAPLKAELPTTKILQDRINANLELDLDVDRVNPNIRYGKFSFEEIYEFVKAAGSIYLTPEKFLFKMDPRARVTAVTPDVINLNNTNDVYLRFRGNWLAQTPCAEPGWCPELVIEDRYGKSLRHQITESHISYPNNIVSDVQISVKLDDISGLQALAAGDLIAWFEYQPRLAEPLAYNSYPNGRLRVPVPDGTLLLFTKPKLIGFKTPTVQAGKELVAIGTGLKGYGTAPRFELVDPDPFRPGALPSVPLTIEQLDRNADPDSEVRLRLPDVLSNGSAVPTGYYKLSMGADPDFGPGAPVEGVLSETTVAVAAANEYAALVVMDLGEFKDDAMEVVYYDAGANGGQRLGSFPVPANADNDSAKTFINGREWLTSAPLHNMLHRIEINCTDGGPDKVCSFAARSIQFFMCAPGTGTKDVWDGIIDTGDKQELWFSKAFDLFNCPPL